VSEIWTACLGRFSEIRLEGSACRLVESQQQLATWALVDSFAEQDLLERMLERAKPPLATGTQSLHPLLAAPFRYPPLRHGSRFGSRFEPGLFYAGRAATTTLAECAYYRFVFWSGMATPPPEPLETQHTLFEVEVTTARGLALQAPPFDEFSAALTHRRSYAATQALGRAMRAVGIEAFEYRSARDPAAGINVALMSPRALASRRPDLQSEWLCETSARAVAWFSSGRGRGELHRFELAQFFVDGALPMPAT
jgi:hypothetical protein